MHAFVLDLRGGLGGADPSFLEVFRNGYSGPLVVLIDGSTRSGKEWIAANLKLNRRATLVGSRTAGAFLSGRWFEIEAGRSAIYLAVSPPPAGTPDLEGKGVEPDVVVPMDLRYSQGEDLQLIKALKTAAALSRGAGEP